MGKHANTLIDGYIEELRDVAYSPHTIRAYQRWLHQYAAHLRERHRSVLAARYDDVVSWRRSLHGSHATVRLALSAVRGFHAWLHSTGLAEVDPARAVRSPRRGDDEHVKITHSPAAIDALLDAAVDPFDAATIALLYYQAMRVAEVAALPTFCLRLDDDVVTVIGKGRKRRDLWIADEARPALRAWMNDGADPMYVFPARSRRSACPHVSPATIDRRLREVAQRAGLDRTRFNPHSLRHARAEHLRAAGVDMAWTSTYLGHASPRMTAHYMNPPTAQRPAV